MVPLMVQLTSCATEASIMQSLAQKVKRPINKRQHLKNTMVTSIVQAACIT